MPSVHEVTIEPLTDEAFAPFGQIIAAKNRPADFRTESGTQGWAIDFRSGKPLIMLLKTPYRGLSFTKLERHFNLTQTFLPVGGSPAVVAVAPPSPTADRKTIPAPDRIRAFLHDGGAADATLADVATAAGCSRFVAYRAFRGRYGLPPSEYQRLLRLRTARRALAGGAAIADAAAASGFADQAHLTRWFRRCYGITPGAYRAACALV